MSNSPTQARDPQTGLFVGRAVEPDPALDTVALQMKNRLLAERPGATVAVQCLVNEAALVWRQCVRLDREIDKRGAVAANGRVKALLRERYRWSQRFTSLISKLPPATKASA